MTVMIFRRFISYVNGKAKKTTDPKPNDVKAGESGASWVGITCGKYFCFAMIPDAAIGTLTFFLRITLKITRLKTLKALFPKPQCSRM